VRWLLAIIATVALTAAAGYFACGLLRVPFHQREMLVAASVAAVAGAVAVVPMLLTRGASQPAVAQAGLVSTVLHLFVSAALGGGALLVKSLSLDPAYVYWLLAMYWTTLIVLVILLAGAVKSAPVGSTPSSPTLAVQTRNETRL
jgi:hypothetical protein